jgi:hypothetical protein
VADIVFLLIIGAFFIVSIAYVKLCDRIIGPDVSSTASGRDLVRDVPPEREAVEA